MADVDRLIELLEGLVKSRPFRPEEVSKKTGLELVKNDAESNTAFEIYKSKPPGPASTGLLLAVELRVPTASASVKDGLILLGLAPGSVITREEIIKRFGSTYELIIPRPEQPPDAPVYFAYPWQGVVVRFGFGRKPADPLRMVVINATGK